MGEFRMEVDLSGRNIKKIVKDKDKEKDKGKQKRVMIQVVSNMEKEFRKINKIKLKEYDR